MYTHIYIFTVYVLPSRPQICYYRFEAPSMYSYTSAFTAQNCPPGARLITLYFKFRDVPCNRDQSPISHSNVAKRTITRNAALAI